MVSPREISWQPSGVRATATRRTCSGATGPSNGQLKAVETYPRTGTGEAAMTGANRSSVSAIDPLVFLREKVSLARREHRHHVHPRPDGALQSLKIGHERVVSHALPRARSARRPLPHRRAGEPISARRSWIPRCRSGPSATGHRRRPPSAGVGTNWLMLCSPSLGPTSTSRTRLTTHDSRLSTSLLSTAQTRSPR